MSNNIAYVPSPEVQKRIQEMRLKETQEKELEAKLNQERLELEQTRIGLVRRTVECESINWEAELLFQLEKDPELGTTPVQLAVNNHRDQLNSRLRNFNQEGMLDLNLAVQAIQSGFRESNIPSEFTVVNERARLRIRVISRVIEARCNKAVEVKRAEAAEKQAATQAATEAAQAKRKSDILQQLSGVQHNFTELGSPHIIGSAPDVRLCRDGGVFQPIPNGSWGGGGGPETGLFPVPASWASHYDEGRIQFLPTCPICKKATVLHMDQELWGFGTVAIKNTVNYVTCKNHYLWDTKENRHSTWETFPPEEPRLALANYGSPRPDGRWIPWNPKDPDGIIAAKSQKDREITKIEEEIARLQDILKLKTTARL